MPLHGSMVANILHAEPPPSRPNPGVESKGQNSSFSEHGHVAFQIKGNDACTIR